jgi:hypothetical protein
MVFSVSSRSIQILSASPCIGRVLGHQGKKNTEEQVKFQSNDDRFFDIRGIVHIDWVPEGQTFNQVYYKKVLTVLHERVRRKDLKCGRRAHGFFTMAMHCRDISGEARDPRVGRSTLLT